MRAGIGSTFIYNIVITFIIVIFAFLAASLSYAKAYKVNSAITNSIEKYEGYNKYSASDIDRILQTMGYRTEIDNYISCPRKDGKRAINNMSSEHRFCIYQYSDGAGYRSYGIMTFISFDVPLIGGAFDIPIYSRTIRLYNF